MLPPFSGAEMQAIELAKTSRQKGLRNLASFGKDFKFSLSYTMGMGHGASSSALLRGNRRGGQPYAGCRAAASYGSALAKPTAAGSGNRTWRQVASARTARSPADGGWPGLSGPRTRCPAASRGGRRGGSTCGTIGKGNPRFRLSRRLRDDLAARRDASIARGFGKCRSRHPQPVIARTRGGPPLWQD